MNYYLVYRFFLVMTPLTRSSDLVSCYTKLQIFQNFIKYRPPSIQTFFPSQCIATMQFCGFHDKNTNILNDGRYRTVVLGARIMFKFSLTFYAGTFNQKIETEQALAFALAVHFIS